MSSYTKNKCATFTMFVCSCVQVSKEGEQITVTPQPTDMIFIRNCRQCKFGVHGKAAKCIIGKL